MSVRRTPIRLAVAATVLGTSVLSAAVASSTATANAAENCAKYAAPNGSDSAAGSSSSPFRSATRLAGSLGVGEVGCVRAGSYSGDVTLTADGSTLRSAPGERATLNVGTLTIANGAEDVTVSDLNIVGRAGVLTTRLAGDRFTFTRNDITNNNGGSGVVGSCVLVADSGETTTGGVITLNNIHECGEIGTSYGHGIYTQNVDGLLIQDNVIRGVGGYAVQLYPKAQRVTVRNNVIDGGLGSIRGGIVIDGDSNQHRIERNVLTYSQTGAVLARVGAGHVSVNNCFWGNPSNTSGSISSSGDITANPGFRDRGASDYRLDPNSPCAAKVGYDTAAKVSAALSGSAPPAPAPSPSPTTSTPPAPEPSPSPTTSTPPATAPPAAGDPRVSLSSPTAGARVRNDVHAIAQASDDGRIIKVELLIDGRLAGTETSAPYDQWLSVARLSRGTHVLTAVAYDDSGRTASASVSFFKR